MVSVIRRWVLMVLVLLSGIGASAASAPMFERLDSLIAAQPQIIAAKEARLAQMKAELARVTSLSQRYALMSRLYEEYAAYQYDSAYAYVSQCLALARQMSDDRLLNESRLDLAHILKVFVALGQAQKAFLDHVFTVGMVLQIAESHAIDRRHVFPVQLSQADAGKFQLAFHVLSSLPVIFSPFHKTDEVAERFHAFSFF